MGFSGLWLAGNDSYGDFIGFRGLGFRVFKGEEIREFVFVPLGFVPLGLVP